jgi:RNA polymerase sigma-70 factor (ECF subfamily)
VGPLPDVLASLSTPRDDPAAAAQFNDQVAHLCRHLDDAERRMLGMRLEGYSTAEIARELGLHHVALRVRLTRLPQRLQGSGVLTDWL